MGWARSGERRALQAAHQAARRRGRGVGVGRPAPRHDRRVSATWCPARSYSTLMPTGGRGPDRCSDGGGEARLRDTRGAQHLRTARDGRAGPAQGRPGELRGGRVRRIRRAVFSARRASRGL